MHRLWILLLFLPYPVFSQSATQNSFTGQWLLKGQREMAAGLELRADSSFEFFLSYGASDRYASGTWKVWGDSLVLQSRKPAGKDFLVQQQSPGGEGYRIRIQDPNPLLAEGVRCFAFSGGKKEIFQAGRNGEIHIPWTDCDTLYLQHLFYPDIATLIKDKNNPNRTFTVTLSPDLAELSFKGIWFWFDAEGFLRCPTNYAFPAENPRFERASR